MSLTPYRDTLRVYKANTFSYSFTFEEDESPLDLTTLTNITVRLFNQNTTVFEHTVSGGDLTISGASDNIISGSATDEVMDIAVRSYDMEVIFDNSGAITTYVALDVKVIDSGSNNSTTAASFEVSITSATGSIGGQPTVLYAQTIEAKNTAETARDEAVTAQQGAETAESNAQTSASNASTSATNASNSASAAATSATQAQTAETNAETAENNAETAYTNTLNALDERDTDLAGYYLNEIGNRVQVGEPIWLPESDPSDIITPPSGYASLFFDSTNSNALSKKDSTGTTTVI